MIKKYLAFTLRKLGLAGLADKFRYQLMRLTNQKKNNAFRQQFPSVSLPPDYLIYESFQIDYHKYYNGGKEDAQWIISLAQPFIEIHAIKILDWGCGPARIIRHFPSILGSFNTYYGTDYNSQSIQWCKTHIPGVVFHVNDLYPPLPFSQNYFNLIFGLSILTHLSKENQKLWSDELFRVTAPGGIVILTTHGNAFVEKLTNDEKNKYYDEELIARKHGKEGHRTFGTFHPPSLMKGIFEGSGFQVVQHKEGTRVHATYISQDVWILKK